MKIRTKDDLIGFVRRKLGDGILAVEVTDDQIDDIVSESIQKFTEFAYEGYSEEMIILPLEDGVTKYKLDNRVIALFEMHVGNSSIFSLPGNEVIQSDLIFMMFGMSAPSTMSKLDMGQITALYAKMENIKRFFKKVPNYVWNGTTKELSFHQNMEMFQYKSVLLKVGIQYEPQEFDDIWGHRWVKDYAVALAEYQQGRNTGKYDTTLVGGAKINYERMISDAKERISFLEEQLFTTYSEPLGIYRV